MLRYLLPLLVFAVQARADIFSGLAGKYGDPLHLVETCARSPLIISFSQNQQSGVLQVYSDQFGGDLQLAIEKPFAVIGLSAGGLEIRFADEETLTQNGATRTWEFRHLPQIRGYCWGNPGQLGGKCINTVVQCEEFRLIS